MPSSPDPSNPRARELRTLTRSGFHLVRAPSSSLSPGGPHPVSTFTLDSIREAAEAKYGSTDIELPNGSEVRLVNVLKLKKDKRAALIALQDGMREDGADQEEMINEAFRLVAATPAQAEALIEAIEGDLTVAAELFQRYVKGTQVGEASGSQG
ncbi:hypothetical protein GCM10010109_68860 [Actinoplanes campanulatus]|nr:hypothetical protein GCM10010109_68860 [Actinoplanes campanulatus]GID42391.1 hypothetical protein Aca09nite_88970 [Actinoplanes campanulatus]